MLCMPPPGTGSSMGVDTATKPRFQRCSQKCSEMVDKRVPDAISVPGGDPEGELRGLGRSWGQCLLPEMQHRTGQGWRGELGDLWRLGSRGSQRERLLHINCQAGCQQHACDTLVTSHQGRGRKEGGRVGSLAKTKKHIDRPTLSSRGFSRSLSVLPSISFSSQPSLLHVSFMFLTHSPCRCCLSHYIPGSQ